MLLVEQENAIRMISKNKNRKTCIFRASPEFRATQFCYGVRQNNDSISVLRNLADWWKDNPASNSYFPQDYQAIVLGLSCVNDSEYIKR